MMRRRSWLEERCKGKKVGKWEGKGGNRRKGEGALPPWDGSSGEECMGHGAWGMGRRHGGR